MRALRWILGESTPSVRGGKLSRNSKNLALMVKYAYKIVNELQCLIIFINHTSNMINIIFNHVLSA